MSRDPQMFIKPELIEAFKEGCKRAGISIMITCVDRDELEQMALYAQGREPLDKVNVKRNLANMLPITEAKNKIVTWTLNSKHVPVIVRLDDKGNPVKKSSAFDFAVVKNGMPVWDVKVSMNENITPDYIEVGVIGESLGLCWGGRFKNPDYPHMQIQMRDT